MGISKVISIDKYKKESQPVKETYSSENLLASYGIGIDTKELAKELRTAKRKEKGYGIKQ